MHFTKEDQPTLIEQSITLLFYLFNERMALWYSPTQMYALQKYQDKGEHKTTTVLIQNFRMPNGLQDDTLEMSFHDLVRDCFVLSSASCDVSKVAGNRELRIPFIPRLRMVS